MTTMEGGSVSDPKEKPTGDQTGEVLIGEVSIGDDDGQAVLSDCPIGEKKMPKKKTAKKKAPAGKVRQMAAAKKAGEEKPVRPKRPEMVRCARPDRKRLPGNYCVSKSGVAAYLVTTCWKDKATGSLAVKLRFGSGTESARDFTIEELERDGVTFYKRRPPMLKGKTTKAAPAGKQTPRKKVKAAASEDKARKAKATRAARKLPDEGTKLYARYKGKNYEAVIKDGAVHHGGKPYPTLSAAGKAVTGKPTCNGWVFWSTEKRAPRKARGKK